MYKEYNIRLVNDTQQKYDAIILAVSHKEFLSLDLENLKKDNNTVIFDTKSCLDRKIIDGRL